MTVKQELIELRGTVTLDPEIKKTVRAAINHIEELEAKLRDIESLTRAIQRTIKM